MPKRCTDRVEDVVASVLVSVLLVVAFAAVLAGMRAHADVIEQARAQAATRTPVTAVLTEDTPRPQAAGEATIAAQVRWTEPDGVERTAQTQAPTGSSAGTPVRVWVDRSHQIVPPPAGKGDAVIAGVGLGVALFVAAAALATALWSATRRLTLARNCVRWEREWVQVEPIWCGRYR